MDSRTPQYVVAALAVALAAGIRWLMDPMLGDGGLLATFIISVAVAVWFGGYLPGVFAMALGYVSINVLFTEPDGAISQIGHAELSILLVYLAASSVVIAIGGQARREKRHSEDSRRQAFATKQQLAAELKDMNRLHELTVRLWRNDELTGILNDVLKASIELLRADRGSIHLYDARRNALIVVTQIGFDGALDDLSVSSGGALWGAAFERGRRIICEDVAVDAACAEIAPRLARLGFIAVQATPLHGSDGKVLGTLSTYFGRRHRPSERDLRMLDLYAQQAERVIERKQSEDAARALNDELASQLARMARLQQVNAQLVRSTDLVSPLAELLDAAAALTGSDAGRVELMQNGLPRTVARCGDVPRADAAAEKAARTAERVVEQIASSELYGEKERAAMLAKGFVSAQSTPLLSRSGQPIGVLTSYYRGRHKPDRRDLDLIDWLTSKGADFIERVQAERALQESEERHRFLVQLGTILNELGNADRRMQTALEFVARRFGISRCGFAQVNVEADRVTIEVDYHAGRESIAGEVRLSDYGIHYRNDGLAGRVTAIEDAAHDERTASCYPSRLAAIGFRSIVNVPLRHGARWVANFWVAHEEPRDWNDAEIALLRSTADRIWLALENARLFGAITDAAARLKAIVDTAADGIITIDETGVIESANPATERIFGHPAAEIVGRNITTLMPEPYSSEHAGYLSRYLRMGIPRIIGQGREVHGLRRDGSVFPLDLAVSETNLNGRRIFTGIVRDITDRRAADNALREADRRKDQFLALLAHELRNPLAPLRNAVEILRRSHDERQIGWSQEVIERQVSHLTRLIDDLLDVSRITRDKLEIRAQRIELADAVQAALETARPMIEERGHTLDVTLPETPIYLDGDLIRLAQVFTNLLSNSAKFVEGSGRIRLTVERQAQEAIVRVEDTGVGIPQHELPHLFDMFFQAAQPGSAHGGLGIGLSLVRRLVQLHEGSVKAESPGPGQGSAFEVRLPVLGEALPLEAQPVTAGVGAPCPARRVLIVDDNADSADSLARLLEITGHETRTVYHGDEALIAAERYRPDIMLLDLGMPHPDGYEVCRRVRQRNWGHELLVVALTGWGRDEDRRATQRAGFDAHLVKPVEQPALESLLRLPTRAANDVAERPPDNDDHARRLPLER